MPIYEYVCRACGHPFEKLVQPSASPPACPACQSQSLQQQFSLFAVGRKSAGPSPASASACGHCGDLRGPGSCAFD
jgi:putative FmdB family regulatory protein